MRAEQCKHSESVCVSVSGNTEEAAGTVGAVTLNCLIHWMTHEESEQMYIKSEWVFSVKDQL